MKTSYVNQMTGKGPFSYDPGMSRPNILFVTMDMVPQEFYNGTRSMETPNQMSLGEDGIYFRHAFATSPLCGPSRASTLTGRFTYITGNSERAHDGHQTHLRSDDLIWPEYLKAVGYHTRHIGKSHVGTEHFMRAFGENASPWDRWSPPWYNEDAYIDFLNSRGLKRFTFEKEIVGQSWNGDRNGNSYGGWLAGQNGEPFPEDALYPAFLTDRAIGVLETREDTSKPFYLQLDYFGPHQPFAIPGNLEEREAEIRESIQLPESWLEWEAAGFPEKSDDPRVYDLYRRNWGMRDRDDMIDYLVANQLQYEILDRQFGRLLSYLKEHDLYDSTMIIFTADHGEMNGRKGCIDKGAYLNPQTLHVPLYLKPAEGQPVEKGSVVESPCSLLDVGPTVCATAGFSIPDRLDGVSLFDTAAGKLRGEAKPIMADVWNHVVPNPCVSKVFEYEGQLYIYSFNTTSDTDELYWVEEHGKLHNLIETEPQLREAAIKSMYRSLSTDPRWEVYNCYLKLEYSRDLQLLPTDNQKFM